MNSCLSKEDVFRSYNEMHACLSKYYPLNKCLGTDIRSTVSIAAFSQHYRRTSLSSFSWQMWCILLTIPVAFRTSQCVPVAFVFQEECQNYIRVLLVGGDRLFACGTNAFTPVCTIRSVCVCTKPHKLLLGATRHDAFKAPCKGVPVHQGQVPFATLQH